MLLLADDDEQALQREVRLRILEVQAVAKICAIEYGKVMRDPHTEESIEHFGYVDGRSQPLFFKKDVMKETDKRGGTDKWNPKAEPSLVLVPEQIVPRMTGTFLPMGAISSFVNSNKTFVAFRTTLTSWWPPYNCKVTIAKEQKPW